MASSGNNIEGRGFGDFVEGQSNRNFKSEIVKNLIFYSVLIGGVVGVLALLSR